MVLALGIPLAPIPLNLWANRSDMEMFSNSVDGNRRYGAFLRLTRYPLGKDLRTYNMSGMVTDKFFRTMSGHNLRFEKMYMRSARIRALVSVLNLATALAASKDYDPDRVWACLEKAGIRERAEEGLYAKLWHAQAQHYGGAS